MNSYYSSLFKDLKILALIKKGGGGDVCECKRNFIRAFTIGFTRHIKESNLSLKLNLNFQLKFLTFSAGKNLFIFIFN